MSLSNAKPSRPGIEMSDNTKFGRWVLMISRGFDGILRRRDTGTQMAQEVTHIPSDVVIIIDNDNREVMELIGRHQVT